MQPRFCGWCLHVWPHVLTDSHPPFVYFTGNLAHTKGKGINTMRSPRTPTRTITFAKVLTALSALLLYYLLLTLKFVWSIFSLLTLTENTWIIVHLVWHSAVLFFISAVLFLSPNCNYRFFCSLCPPLSASAFLWSKMGVLTLYSSFSVSEVITIFPYSLRQVVFYQCRNAYSL